VACFHPSAARLARPELRGEIQLRQAFVLPALTQGFCKPDFSSICADSSSDKPRNSFAVPNFHPPALPNVPACLYALLQSLSTRTRNRSRVLNLDVRRSFHFIYPSPDFLI